MFFVHEIKKTGNEFSKGIVIADNFDSAKQAYHAYLGAYAYGRDPDTTYVQCAITDINGASVLGEVWKK